METRIEESPDPAWYVATRWQQYDGEVRANALRVISLAAFYLVHALNFYRPMEFFQLGPQPGKAFHLSVTIIAITWALMALAVDMCLRHHVFPKSISLITTMVDLLLLTTVLCMGGGLQSPLVAVYPLILILAALRVDLRLIRWATTGAIFGYLFVAYLAKWPQLETPIATVPRYAQLMTLLAIALSGIMLGQLIRQLRRLAERYSIRKAVGGDDV